MKRPLTASLALAGMILGTPATDACAQAPDRHKPQAQPEGAEHPSHPPRSRSATNRQAEAPPEESHPIGQVIEPDSPRDALRKIMMLQSLVDDKLELRGDTRRDVEDKFEEFLGVLREAAGAVPSDERADEARDIQRRMRQAHEARDMDEYRRLRSELNRLMRGPKESETPELAPFLQDIYGDLEPAEARRYVHLLGRLDLVKVDESDEIPLRKFIRLLLAPQVDLANDQRQAVGSLIKKHKEGLTDPKLTPFERRKAFEQFQEAIYAHLSDQQREMIENRLNPPKRPDLPPVEEEDMEVAEGDEPRPTDTSPTQPEPTETAAQTPEEEAKAETKPEESAAEKPAEGEPQPEETPEAQPESKEEPPVEPETPEKQEPETPPEQPIEPEQDEEPTPEPPAPKEPAPEPPVEEEPAPPKPDKPAPKEEEKPAPDDRPEKPREEPAPKPEKESPPPKQEPRKEQPAPEKKPGDRGGSPESKNKPEDTEEQ